MQPSIHYYVLSLSGEKSRLYEGFREKLIDIQNSKFPCESSIDTTTTIPSNTSATLLRNFMIQTDQHFAHYFGQDPHRVVVVGKKNQLAIFNNVTEHREAIIGSIEGDYTATSTHDLGKIVWPLVKEAIAGANKNAMRDLMIAAGKHRVVSGIQAVGQSAESQTGTTLYVEEDYHVRGSIHKKDHSLIISSNVNIWEVIDDVVDIIIEKVLKIGGTVIFLSNGSLMKLDRIAMILRAA